MKRQRRFFRPAAERLEARGLLSTVTFSGFLLGHNPAIPAPNNPLVGTDVYSASGKTNVGTVSIAGTDSFAKTLINPTTYRVMYTNGAWTMTLGNGSVLDITYTGNGTTPIHQHGPFTQFFRGKAVQVSGPQKGRVYSFVETGAGFLITQDSFALKFTIRG